MSAIAVAEDTGTGGPSLWRVMEEGEPPARHVEQARTLGAEHVIDYTQEDFTRDGRRYDLIPNLVNAVKGSGWEPQRVVAWTHEMTRKDRVGFICDEELKSLHDQFRQ